MAFIEINPRYRELLESAGLTTPEAFLALPSVILSGHPDRNVGRVRIGTGRNSVQAFLKREHRVPWKERLVNVWQGFGNVSKSEREAMTLRALKENGIPCSDWLAVGEDESGTAFLLVRELEEAVDLRL